MRYWTEAEVKQLKEMIEHKDNIEMIAKTLDRSKVAVDLKIRKLGLALQGSNTLWKKEESENFKNDWISNELSLNKLSKKYNRTINGLKIHAQRNNFGPRGSNRYELSLRDIANEMNISYDRVHRWKQDGLKVVKRKIGKTRYVVKIEDLEEYLKTHTNKFDASQVSYYLFANEPEWFKEKRQRDLEKSEYRNYSVWTDEQIELLKDLIKLGRTYDEIANKLNKSRQAVITKAVKLDIVYTHPKHWQMWEIRILKDNAGKVPLQEIAVMLNNNRTVKAIQSKCADLGIKYRSIKK